MKIIKRIFAVLLCLTLLCPSLPVSALETYNPKSMRRDYSYYSDYEYDDIIIETDFGEYGGKRVVIFGIENEERTDEPYDLYIGDVCFKFSYKAYADRFMVYFWRAYSPIKFISVKEAYEIGYLSSRDIYDIALQYGVETYTPEELKYKDGEIEWRFDPVAGKLRVDGSGKMPDYEIINGKTTSPIQRWKYDIREIEVDSLDSVGDAAFYGCENLTSVYLNFPDTIGKNAFAECKNLTSVETSAWSIGEKAFYNCTKLSRLDFSDRLRTIGKSAFENCSSLTEFDFPQGIRKVAEGAFKGCDSVSRMSFSGKAPELYSGMLKEFKGDILYPADSPFWTDDVLNGFSKTAKWVPYDAPAINRVENYFDDLHPGCWYLSGIQYCYGRDIMQGTGNYLFEPNGLVTREQMAMVLYNYLEADETYTSYSFNDVKAGSWYADAVEWMYQNGYTKGISRDEFGVGRPVTRQDLVTLIYNAIFRDYKNEYWLGEYHIKGGIKSFGDVDDISDYAYDAMRLAVEVCDSSMCRGTGEIKPILYGNSGKLNPKDSCTRAQAAAIIQRSFYADYFSPVSKVTPPSS